MSGLAALCLWACSDEANVSQPANAENDVYVEFGGATDAGKQFKEHDNRWRGWKRKQFYWRC